MITSRVKEKVLEIDHVLPFGIFVEFSGIILVPDLNLNVKPRVTLCLNQSKSQGESAKSSFWRIGVNNLHLSKSLIFQGNNLSYERYFAIPRREVLPLEVFLLSGIPHS